MPKADKENKPKNTNDDLVGISNHKNARLVDAVCQGDLNLANILLTSGSVDVNCCDKNGSCMLNVAIAGRDVAMVKLLLKFRPNLSPKDTKNCPPLWTASLAKEFEIVKLLVLAGADVNEPLEVRSPFSDFYTHERGMSLLHVAVLKMNPMEVRLLLDHGAEVNALDKEKCSPLQAALKLHNAEIAKMLLKKGASVNSTNNLGETILHSALFFGNEDLLTIILFSHVNFHDVDNSGKNALHFLSQSTKENLEVAEYLLEKGVFVNQADIYCGVTPLIGAVMSNKPELIKLYLKFGADVNMRISCGYSSLNLAAVLCRSNVLGWLLKKGADVNSFPHAGETALSTSCRQFAKKKIKVLLEYGADVNIKDRFGKTAIENLPYFHTKAAKLLVKHIVKLESLNLFVEDRILIFIENTDRLKSYRESCLQEIQTLKNNRFYNNYSFYYVLAHSIDKLYKLTTNEEFTRNFKSVNVVAMFPLYGKDINTNFTKAKQRMKSQNKIIEHLSFVFYQKYDPVLEHIAKYLKLSDIVV